MSIVTREVKNKRDSAGILTGHPGQVYDVYVKYREGNQNKTYSRKGFKTKKEAQQHEAAMRMKFLNPSYVPPTSAQTKMTVEQYMTEWIERHGKTNLRPSTFSSYKSHMRNHIFPFLGSVPLVQLSPAMLDDLFQHMFEKGLSQSSVKYAHRILGVAMEHARKYHYIERNPARDTITKFGKQGKTPDPYTIAQMKTLIARVTGSDTWELMVILGGLYGLRLSEILGLRWRNVNLDQGTFGVVEQLPYRIPKGTNILTEMAPVKSSERILPITEITRPYFERQKELQERQKTLSSPENPYYDSDLVVAKPDGRTKRREGVSSNFGQLLRRLEMPHIRFHDLRHSAATNLHQLTGDFYTVGQILGHSLKGVGIQLNLSNNLDSVTAAYVDVRLERKRVVLETYHNEVLS